MCGKKQNNRRYFFSTWNYHVSAFFLMEYTDRKENFNSPTENGDVLIPRFCDSSYLMCVCFFLLRSTKFPLDEMYIYTDVSKENIKKNIIHTDYFKKKSHTAVILIYLLYTKIIKIHSTSHFRSIKQFTVMYFIIFFFSFKFRLNSNYILNTLNLSLSVCLCLYWINNKFSFEFRWFFQNS